jgi:hypothetical protein
MRARLECRPYWTIGAADGITVWLCSVGWNPGWNLHSNLGFSRIGAR